MIGKEILNYIIVSKIGDGGMGTVYLAEHKFIQQQKVAIKVIRKDMVNESSRRRLQEEAEHLAGLNHPNIVKFLNYHIDNEGNVYLIMEYAEGDTLAQYIRTKTGLIVESRILPIFEPILDAFDYAHKKKVIHRDIKPSNIIVTPDGTPKILDFGISTILDENVDEGKEEAFIMGTPSFMSPEQVRGQGIDFRSDIYSLGVLLFQMLTGTAPYDTTTLSEFQIQEKVLTEPLPRMKSYYRYISDKMQAIVDKATAKDPKDRYQTCADFKKAMIKVLRPDPVPVSTIAIIAAVAVILVGGGVFWWDYTRVKTRYYKDYVEQWGIPQGIGRVSKGAMAHREQTYRFEYRKGKLRRMTLVNSNGSIVSHHDSEQMDRPSDMLIFYGDRGRIDYARVIAQSGQVQYIKDYNDRLNTVIFQYDDEFRSEKAMAASTLTLFSNPLDSDARKGSISRWHLTYDENGYVTRLQYASAFRPSVGDADGIYAREYVRDDKGRVLEEHYLGFDGKPKGTKGGLGIRRHTYNDKDEWIRTEYLTSTGEESNDGNGVPIVDLTYDRYGNRIKEVYVNRAGEMVLRTDTGSSGMTYEIDKDGHQVTRAYIGTDGQPCFSKDGCAGYRFKYDENGYISEMASYDLDGNICLNTYGWARQTIKNDTRGNTVEYWLHGTDGELTEVNGVSGAKIRYSDNGNIVEYICHGSDGNPCLQSNMTAGYSAEYDARGLLTRQTNLDTEMKPCIDINGVVIITIEYNTAGNPVRTAYYDATGSNLVLNSEGIAGWKCVYDENGNETERDFFDRDGKPGASNAGYAKMTFTYDEFGNQTSYRYYTISGKPAIVEKVAGYDYKYDERGNVLESFPVGKDGKLAKGMLTARYKYDESDNVIEYALFGIGDVPAMNAYDYHKYTNSYNSRNQLTEVRYYDTDGQLTAYAEDTYAIQKNEYDEKGNRVKVWYFDEDEKPVACEEGWASSSYEYDGMGRVIRQLFFDVKGNPTDPDTMVPEGVVQYDKWGNAVYLAAMDGNGKLIINPKTGWSIKRTEYDLKGNTTSETCFDTGDKPTDCSDGYHKTVYEYDGNSQLVKMYFLDKEGKPVNCNNGYQSVEIDYDGNVATARKYLNAAGKKIYSESWNGSGWIADSNPELFREQIRQFNSSCPMELNDSYGGMTLSSIRATGNRSCQFTFRLPYSKYEMSYDMQASYRKYARSFMVSVRDILSGQMSVSGLSFTGILYDSKNRELGKVYL